ncbi:MAG: hypothetical protein NW224_09745 [Leptolyngbyaceae cyanobacterium bins.302]|nr:hypothetical protein [Leptolyngbyaceae cyanobacterium bins.302]
MPYSETTSSVAFLGHSTIAGIWLWAETSVTLWGVGVGGQGLG